MTKSSSSSSKKDKAQFVKFKGHSIIICVNGKKSKAINPATKQPYVVWFINNTSLAPGLGTFESPFPTLSQVQSTSAPNDIIYIYTGDGTDTGMNMGIILKYGQQILGSGIDHIVKTTCGRVEIPPQAGGSPLLSTISTTEATTHSAVVLNTYDNVVSGLYLLDNYGGGTGGSDFSGGVRIEKGLNYHIMKNKFGVASTNGGGTGVNIYGGGNISVEYNTFIGMDTGDSYGIGISSDYVNGVLNAYQGKFEFHHNLFTGADVNTGLDLGISVSPVDNPSPIIGNLHFSVKGNTFNSQTSQNPFGDNTGAILFNVKPPVSQPFILNIEENNIVIPPGLVTSGLLFGIDISAHGPGPAIASLHKNVSLTIPPTPGFRFRNFGDPTNLQLAMGYNNFGSSIGPF